ncbi:hypothetical protein [Chitinophaga eiseniae]|uniref:hypothetical protein n=1 Tax=Chitinophaga eiseniae TaxID=634771 RepID=UPI001F404E28|nr:hypothetical protein [Chitinophaga eiseniae]
MFLYYKKIILTGEAGGGIGGRRAGRFRRWYRRHRQGGYWQGGTARIALPRWHRQESTATQR